MASKQLEGLVSAWAAAEVAANEKRGELSANADAMIKLGQALKTVPNDAASVTAYADDLVTMRTLVANDATLRDELEALEQAERDAVAAMVAQAETER